MIFHKFGAIHPAHWGKSNIRDAFRLLHGTGRGYTLPKILGQKQTNSGHKIWDSIRGGVTELIYQPIQPNASTTIQAHFDLAQHMDQLFVRNRPKCRIANHLPRNTNHE